MSSYFHNIFFPLGIICSSLGMKAQKSHQLWGTRAQRFPLDTEGWERKGVWRKLPSAEEQVVKLKEIRLETQLESSVGASERVGTLYCRRWEIVKIRDWQTEDHGSVFELTCAVWNEFEFGINWMQCDSWQLMWDFRWKVIQFWTVSLKFSQKRKQSINSWDIGVCARTRFGTWMVVWDKGRGRNGAALFTVVVGMCSHHFPGPLPTCDLYFPA